LRIPRMVPCCEPKLQTRSTDRSASIDGSEGIVDARSFRRIARSTTLENEERKEGLTMAVHPFTCYQVQAPDMMEGIAKALQIRSMLFGQQLSAAELKSRNMSNEQIAATIEGQKRLQQRRVIRTGMPQTRIAPSKSCNITAFPWRWSGLSFRQSDKSGRDVSSKPSRK